MRAAHEAARPIVRALLFGAGVLLVAAGEYHAAYSDAFTQRVDQAVGQWGETVAGLLPPLYPSGVASGIILFVAGSLLMACALGRPLAPIVSERPRPAELRARTRRLATGLFAVTVALVVVAGVALWQPHPGARTVVAWVGVIAAGMVTAVVLDGGRGTHLGNPFAQRWEAASLLVIVAFDLFLIGHDLADWRWAGTPDESFFFMTAKGLAEGIRRFPLSEDGVFGYHPILSSYYQAAFMKLFGADAFGWRLSSAAALAGSLPGLYLLARELWGRPAAYAAVLFFAPAQLAVAFAHQGYNNVHVYLVVLLSLGVLAWAIRRASLFGYYLAGCLAALGFFTFHPARFAPVLLLLLGWSLGGLSLRRGQRAPTYAVVGGIVLTALPILLNIRASLERMLEQTALAGGPAGGSRIEQLLAGVWSSPWVVRLWNHWFVSLFYAVWSKTDHFVNNPVADPFSAALATTGWWLSAATITRHAGSRFLVPAFLLSVLAVCATSPYPHPPLTRLLFLSPFTALFAGLTLDQLTRRLAGSRGRWRVATAVGGVIVACAALWNVAATRYNVRVLNHGYGDGTTSELIRIVESVPPNCRVIYIQRGLTFMDSVDFVLAGYGVGGRFTYLRPFDQRAIAALEHVMPPAVVAYDVREPDERARIEGILTNRFPGHEWRDSDANQPWSLRYFYLPEDS